MKEALRGPSLAPLGALCALLLCFLSSFLPTAPLHNPDERELSLRNVFFLLSPHIRKEGEMPWAAL